MAPTSSPTPPPPPPQNPAPKLNFRRHQRLSKALEFASVFDAKVRKAGGPLIVFAAPNQLDHSRLGLSVGRRIGNAVVRNRVKRRLREAFRLDQARLPPGYDYVVTVRPHEPLPLAAYRRLLLESAAALQTEWNRRRRRAGDLTAPGGEEGAG